MPPTRKRQTATSRTRSRSRSPRIDSDNVPNLAMLMPVNFDNSDMKLAIRDRVAVGPLPLEFVKQGFETLGGLDAVIKILTEEIQFGLRARPILSSLKLNSSHHFFIHGPSGLGKTSLGKGLQAFASMYSPRIAYYEMTGEDGIEEVFQSARKLQPAIVFADDIDGPYSERFRVQFCYELDNLRNEDLVFVVATSKTASIHQAYTVSWRLSRVIGLTLPAAQARFEVLKKKTLGWSGVADSILHGVVTRTQNWSTASLCGLCQMVGEIAVRRTNPQLTFPGIVDYSAAHEVQLVKEDFAQALDIMAG